MFISNLSQEALMQFINLAAQQHRIRAKIDANIQAVLSHGKYITGPEVHNLEERLSCYVGVKHAISCSSGTDALLLALMAYGVWGMPLLPHLSPSSPPVK